LDILICKNSQGKKYVQQASKIYKTEALTGMAFQLIDLFLKMNARAPVHHAVL